MGVVVSFAEILNQGWSLATSQVSESLTDRLQDRTFRRSILRAALENAPEGAFSIGGSNLKDLFQHPVFADFVIDPLDPERRQALEDSAMLDGIQLDNDRLLVEELATAFREAAWNLATPIERLMFKQIERLDETNLHSLNATLDTHAQTTAILAQTTQLISLAQGDRFEQRLSSVPPDAAIGLRQLAANNRVEADSIIDAVDVPLVHPRRALEELMNDPPAWIGRLSGHGVSVLGHLCRAHGLPQMASQFFEAAADRGGPDRPRLLALAAMMALGEGRESRAARLVERAKRIASDPHPLVQTVEAMIAKDPQAMVTAAASARLDPDVCVHGAAAHQQLGNIPESIRLLRQSVENFPWMAGAKIRLSKLLGHRAAGLANNERKTLLDEALRLALEARDTRRKWGGNSAEAVATYCLAAGVMLDHDAIIRVGCEPPIGEATEEEAAEAKVMEIVVVAAEHSGRLDLAETVAAAIKDPVSQAIAHGDTLAKSGSTDLAMQRYLAGWAIAEEPGHRFLIQLGLANIGYHPLPGAEALEAADDADSAYVLAISEIARDELDDAIARLRPWQHRNFRCGNLLASAQHRSGDINGSVDTLRAVWTDFGAVDSVVEATRILAAKGRLKDADELASKAMLDATRPEQRRTLLRLMCAYAMSVRDWPTGEKHATRMIELDPSDTEARWLLVANLYNQRRLDETWTEFARHPQLEPVADDELIVTIDLLRRFRPGLDTWEQVLDLQARQPDDEQLHAHTVWAIMMLGSVVEAEPPEPLRKRTEAVRDQFFERYPDSSMIWQIDVGSTAEDLMAALEPTLRSHANQVDTALRLVTAGNAPIGILSLAANRPYALVAVQMIHAGAAIYPLDPNVAAIERQDALSALGSDAVIDTTALALMSAHPELLTTMLRNFRSITATSETMHDLRTADDRLTEHVTGFVGWDVDSDQPVVRDSDSTTGVIAARVRWMLDAAASMSEVSHPALIELSAPVGVEESCYISWLGPVDLAKGLACALVSDDAALRALARSAGVPAFGSIALAEALDVAAGTTEVHRLIPALRRQSIVDLPVDLADLQLMAEEMDHRGDGAAGFALTRPALWTAGVPVAELFMQMVSANLGDHDQIAVLVHQAIVGACSLIPDTAAEVRAVSLIASSAQAVNFDAEAFRYVVEAVRHASGRIGIDDPLPAALSWMFERWRDQDIAEAGRSLLALVEKCDETIRVVARRIVFE